MSPDEQAFFDRIVADPDDDTPRLAFADWLEERGDPDRGDFIRVQCRLADLSPADPRWEELIDREQFLTARLSPRLVELSPPVPEGFYFPNHFTMTLPEQPFRRGFPFFINCQVNAPEWTPEKTDVVGDSLKQLVEQTTVRGVNFSEIPPARFLELLAAPAFAELRGLAVRFDTSSRWWEDMEAAAYRRLAESPAAGKLHHLSIYGGISKRGAAALAGVGGLPALRRLTIQYLTAPPAELQRLTATGWFRQVQNLRIHLHDPTVAGPVLAGLGELPELHTLALPELAAEAIRGLVAGRFPALARLNYSGRMAGTLNQHSAAALAKAQFPALAVFQVSSRSITTGAFAEVLRAEWFPRLRVLDVSDNAIGDRGIAALASGGVGKSLRVLRLGDNMFGTRGLAALSKAGSFPELRALDLGAFRKPKGKTTEADMIAFLSVLAVPQLRRLDLTGWPVGDAGAKVIASSPIFANLLRLNLTSCGIGDLGAEALFASPHLRGLEGLWLGNNRIQFAADALADLAVLPRLGVCCLSMNQLSDESKAKLGASGRHILLSI